MIKPPKAILFDLDGTLLHSAVHFVEIINQLLQAAQLPRIDEAVLRPHISGGVVAMLRAVFGASLAGAELSSLRQQFLQAYEMALAEGTPCYFPGVAPLLETLQHKNIPYGIVTNKQQCYGEAIVAKAFFNRAVGCVVYGDTLAQAKPAPQPLWLACQQLGVNPKETWFVGDSLVDMQAADRANCVGIVAAYGYVTAHWQQWPAAHALHQPIDLLALL